MNTHYPIAKLQRAIYNPRFMPDSEMEALMHSLKTFGCVEPIVVNVAQGREGVLVGGHQRTTAIEKLLAKGIVPAGVIETEVGSYAIPCMEVSLGLEQEKVLNLGLNKIRGKWDDDKLANLIIELKGSEYIPASGFRDDEISRILDASLPADREENPAEGDPLTPRSVPGEIYQLGPHRLICGDSTDPATLDKLLEGQKAAMAWTDPPYNVAYEAKGKTLTDAGKESIKNDAMSAADFRKLADDAMANMLANLVDGGGFYICTGWSSYPDFRNSILNHGAYHSAVIVWIKNSAALGWSDYKFRGNEWIAKGKKVPASQAEAIIYGWQQGAHVFHGSGEFDVWEMPRKATSNYLHPTEKPDWLPMKAIRNSSKRGDIVLDLFGGSGSVMAAAEKTGRRAFMVELDPKFCDVIRDRWDRLQRQQQEMLEQSQTPTV